MIAALCCVMFVFVPALSNGDPQPSLGFSSPEESQILLIDGSKNPELIPQWNVWEYAFDILSQATEETLPTVLYKATSNEERDFIIKEARAQAARKRTTQKKMLDGAADLLRQPADIVNNKTREANIQYRWTILSARDRLLAGLEPLGQIKLSEWVEARKAAFRIRVPKKELAHYRLPQ